MTGRDYEREYWEKFQKENPEEYAQMLSDWEDECEERRKWEYENSITLHPDDNILDFDENARVYAMLVEEGKI